MCDCKSAKTLMKRPEEGFPYENTLKKSAITKLFKELIGCLIYLMNTLRPDLLFSVN